MKFIIMQFSLRSVFLRFRSKYPQHSVLKKLSVYVSPGSRDSSVGIALGYGLDDRGSIPGGCWEFFSKPPRRERLWGPPRLLSYGYRGLFPWGKSGRGVKLATHLHLVPRSKNEWSYTSTPPIRLHSVVLN
jgi:hypothetical protein